MKLRASRIARAWNNEPLLPDLHQGTLRTAVVNIIKILDDHPKNGLTGYKTMTQMQAAVMHEYWRRYDQMPKFMTQEQFFSWFTTKATFPDIIRRACQWLHAQKLVEIDPKVEADAEAKGKAIQGQMSGVR